MPVVREGYAYAHMPKTGGSWLSSYLKKAQKFKFAGKLHQPLRDLPKPYWENALRLGTIRDPWSWYVSWFQHMSASKNGSKFQQDWVPEGEWATWEDTLYGQTHPERGRLPTDDRSVVYVDPDRILAKGYGFYSYLFYNIYGDGEDNLLTHTFLQTPKLYEAVEELFQEPVDRERWKPYNTAQERPHSIMDWDTAWTPERVEWVRQAEAGVIELFGFTEPGVPVDAPLIRLPH